MDCDLVVNVLIVCIRHTLDYLALTDNDAYCCHHKTLSLLVSLVIDFHGIVLELEDYA